MNVKNLVLSCTLLLSICDANAVEPSSPPTAADDPKPGLSSKVIDKLKLSVSLVQDAKNDINNQVSFLVDLENFTEDTIQVNSVYILVGDDIINTRPSQTFDSTKEFSGLGNATALPNPYNYPSDGQWSGPEQSNSFDLASNGRKNLILTIPSGDGGTGKAGFLHYFSTLLKNTHLLTFSPNNYDIHLIVDYEMGTKQRFSQRATIKVPFTATWGAIMLGGIVGVFLLFMLRITVAVVDESKIVLKFSNAPDWDGFNSAWKKMCLRAVWVGSSEFVAALVWIPSVIVICVLLMRMKPESFPITFQVNDFTGGVMLGLFARVLVEPLIRKLFPDNLPTSPSGIGEGSSETQGKGEENEHPANNPPSIYKVS